MSGVAPCLGVRFALAAMLKLSFHLLKMFSEGSLTAVSVQRLAAAAVEDGWGADDAVARKLARLGTSGKHSSHVLRDLVRLIPYLGIAPAMPEPYYVSVPGKGGAMRKVGCFLPHEQAHLTISKDGLQRYLITPEEFQQGDGLGRVLLQWAAGQEIDPDAAKEFAAIGLHADGVSYNATQRVGQSRSAAVSAWNFISAPADGDRGARHLFFAVSKKLLCDCGCEGFHTIDALNAVFAWSMLWLMLGVCPGARHDGSPWTAHDRRYRLCGNLSVRAALLQVRGDWEWLAQAFRLRHYSAEEFCWCCDATHAGPMSYLNFAGNAPWRASLVGHMEYFLRLARRGFAPSALFKAPGFVYEYLTIDSMHCVDLGVFADFAGSLFWMEISNKTLHDSYAAGLTWLNEQLADFYAASTGLSEFIASLPAIKPTDGGFPSLKSKAAQCRHLAPFLVYLARRHARMNYQIEDARLNHSSARYRELVVELADNAVSYHRSCEAIPFSEQACQSAMSTFLVKYAEMRLLFRTGIPEAEQAAQPFGCRPKHHMAEHLVREKIQLYGSPRQFWCYGDEDFIGLVKRICACTAHPRTMERRLLSKYTLYAALRAWAFRQGIAWQ